MALIKVSIIMATFNRAHLIAESLKSISQQTFKNWECLVIDDGSSDYSIEVIEQFTGNDSRFKYYKRSNIYRKGLPGCRNYGLDLAKGEYIIFFDDDDIVHPKNLKVCLGLLENTETDFCHYKKQSFTDKPPKFLEILKPIQKFSINICDIENVVTNKIALASCTVIWKKECFAKIRFNESLSYAEEWECYTRILLQGCKGTGIDEVLYFNRKHPESNTGEFWEGDKKRRASNENAIKLVIKNLYERDLLSKKLFKHFVQKSIFLKNKEILNYLLKLTESKVLIQLKYRLFYKFYPIVVLGHRTKKLLKKIKS